MARRLLLKLKKHRQPRPCLMMAPPKRHPQHRWKLRRLKQQLRQKMQSLLQLTPTVKRKRPRPISHLLRIEITVRKTHLALRISLPLHHYILLNRID